MLGWLRELVLSILSSLGLYDKNAVLVVLGLDNAGKSTLLHKLTSGRVAAFPPTERPHVEEFRLGGISFRAWDLGGHEAVRHLWGDYVAHTHGLVFVVDAADADRLEEANWELAELLREPALDGVPTAVLFNKADLPQALPDDVLWEQVQWQVHDGGYGSYGDGSYSTGGEGGNGDREGSGVGGGPRRVRAFRASVLQGQGYVEAFQWLAQQL